MKREQLAIVIPGELRFRDKNHFETFLEYIEGIDTYISTRHEYKKLASELSANYILTPNKEQVYPGRMYQWYHLQNILQSYHYLLSKYTTVVKLRTDVMYDISLANVFSKHSKSNILYANSDRIFYTSGLMFIHTFADIFKKFKKYMNTGDVYHPINYDNLLNTEIEQLPDVGYNDSVILRTEWLVYPSNIYTRSAPTNRCKKSMESWKRDILYENIKKNRDIISSTQKYTNFNKPHDITFPSEKYFALHAINNAVVKATQLPGPLMHDRKEFCYGKS